MKQLLLLIGTTFLLSTSNAQSVSINDFKKIEGSWSGELTYLDYTSNKPESIKSTLTGSLKGNDKFKMEIGYPSEKNRGGADVYKLEDNGTMISGMKVIERSLNNDVIKIILEDKGKDGNDNKPSTFHYILEIGMNKFIMTKLVKFDGEENFFQRNQYVFTR